MMNSRSCAISTLAGMLGSVLAANPASAFALPPTPSATVLSSPATVSGAALPVDLGAFLAPYLRILQAHVKDGRVDYAGIRRDDAKNLAAFVASLDFARPESFGATRQQFAFYLHAYNAFAIEAVVEHAAVQSVKDVPGFFTTKSHRIGGVLFSLDDLEHEILQKRFADPRMHFALVCGAKSCPSLDPSLSSAERFEEGLEEGSRRFVEDDRNVRFDAARGVLHLSILFEWFRADFAAKYGSVNAFLAQYLSSDRAALLASRKWKVEYSPYDWSLNGL